MVHKQKKIPFVNLSGQFIELKEELTAAFHSVGESGNYILGDSVQQFEAAIAKYCQVNYAVSVANGSDALFLSLKALGIGRGDEVITATNSFIASAWVIAATGAKPVLVDVCNDLNIDPDAIENSITSKTKAVMPVHLAGRPASMNKINEIANKAGLFVIEDAAQSIGAKYHGKSVGSLGNLAGFSLHPLKNLGVYGDGGFITTDDEGLADKLRILRNHGLRTRDNCVEWGYNSRLDTMQAAFALIKLKYLDSRNERCRKIANIYQNNLKELVNVPLDQPWEENVYHNFVIVTKKRDELKIYLEELGIGTAVHYPVPIHLQEAAKELKYKKGFLPNAERLSDQMISLPIYPELSDMDVLYIIESIKKFFM